MFQKIAKHRANDASNDVHRPPLSAKLTFSALSKSRTANNFNLDLFQGGQGEEDPAPTIWKSTRCRGRHPWPHDPPLRPCQGHQRGEEKTEGVTKTKTNSWAIAENHFLLPLLPSEVSARLSSTTIQTLQRLPCQAPPGECERMLLIDWCSLLPHHHQRRAPLFAKFGSFRENKSDWRKLNSLVLGHATEPSARANIQHSACKVRNSVPRLRENAVPQQPGLAAFDSTENTFSNRSVEPCICMDWLE